MNAEKLDFDNGEFDLIFSCIMFHETSRKALPKILKECHRVLEKGGVLRIVVPDMKKLIEAYLVDKDSDKFLENSLLACPSITTLKEKIYFLLIGFRHHQWMYDFYSLKRLIANHGFKNIVEQSPGTSLIEKPDDLNLNERADESLYIEAIK